MDHLVKALLLGVSLRWRDGENGVKHGDTERQHRLTEAIKRLTIHVRGLEPDTLSSMLDSGEQVLEWLHEHPKAKVVLGYWCIDIHSPEFDDVDHERFDCPFDHSAAVEDFSKTRSGDEWHCAWSLG